MTKVVVHRSVQEQLGAMETSDPQAAAALVEQIRALSTSTRNGIRLDQPGWRAYRVSPGMAVIATGIGTGRRSSTSSAGGAGRDGGSSGVVRVIAAGPLPEVYDRDRLRAMAQSALLGEPPARTSGRGRREAGVPQPAQRSRVVSLDDATSQPSQKTPKEPAQGPQASPPGRTRGRGR